MIQYGYYCNCRTIFGYGLTTKKQKDLLENLSPRNFENAYSIHLLYYELYKKERKYDLALENLEEYKYLTDSLIMAENEAKILNIERKYNDQKG